MKFYECRHCGNMVGIVNEGAAPMMCCGEKMHELVPGIVDASIEKHVPVVARDGNMVKVMVGSLPHPMEPEHFIEWVALETKQGNQRKPLKGTPSVCFSLTDDDAVVAVYAYCNLHGLWKDVVK